MRNTHKHKGIQEEESECGGEKDKDKDLVGSMLR